MKAAKGSVPQDQGPSVPLQRHKGHNQESESPRRGCFGKHRSGGVAERDSKAVFPIVAVLFNRSMTTRQCSKDI